MGAKDCCLMGLRKKRCGANWNEGGLSKEGYGARWKLMKVVLGVVVAAAEVGQQGHHVASFETKKWIAIGTFVVSSSLGFSLTTLFFLHSENDSDDEEVLHELGKYENAGTLRRERIIKCFDGDDLAFECMIGFRKFTAYLDPFLPMNIISRKAYNTIMVDRLEGMGKNLVAIIRDVYVFVGIFTYIIDFVVFDRKIGDSFMRTWPKFLMQTFRKPLKLIFMTSLRHPYEKNKFMYKNCLNLGPEYQVNESMKEGTSLRGHVIFDEMKLEKVLRKFYLMTLGRTFLTRTLRTLFRLLSVGAN
ncbi:hypothetical protein Tco_1482785 [Tanacetum coccineum]